MYRLISIWFILGVVFQCFGAQSVIVSWDANTEEDLSGYKIYWGNESRFVTVKVISQIPSQLDGNGITLLEYQMTLESSYYSNSIDVGNVTQKKIQGLNEGTWFFACTAYDLSGNESEYSEEVSIEILPQQIRKPLAPILTIVGDSTTVDDTTYTTKSITFKYEIETKYDDGTPYDEALIDEIQFWFWPEGDWTKQDSIVWDFNDTSIKFRPEWLKSGWWQICSTIIVNGVKSECNDISIFLRIFGDLAVTIKGEKGVDLTKPE